MVYEYPLAFVRHFDSKLREGFEDLRTFVSNEQLRYGLCGAIYLGIEDNAINSIVAVQNRLLDHPLENTSMESVGDLSVALLQLGLIVSSTSDLAHTITGIVRTEYRNFRKLERQPFIGKFFKRNNEISRFAFAVTSGMFALKGVSTVLQGDASQAMEDLSYAGFFGGASASMYIKDNSSEGSLYEWWKSN